MGLTGLQAGVTVVGVSLALGLIVVIALGVAGQDDLAAAVSTVAMWAAIAGAVLTCGGIVVTAVSGLVLGITKVFRRRPDRSPDA